MRLVALLLLALTVLVGCGAGPYYVAADSQLHEVRGSQTDIQILTGEPTAPYITVGVIDWDIVRFSLKGPTFEEAVPKLRELAWKHGGDAVVVRHAVEGTTRWTLRIVADVIRFKG